MLSLLQVIFPIQDSNRGLPHRRQILDQLLSGEPHQVFLKYKCGSAAPLWATRGQLISKSGSHEVLVSNGWGVFTLSIHLILVNKITEPPLDTVLRALYV